MNVEDKEKILLRKAESMKKVTQVEYNIFRKYKPLFFVPKKEEDIKNIQPDIKFCKNDWDTRVWDILIKFQSSHDKNENQPGRQMRFLVMNKNNNHLLGLIRLAGPIGMCTIREDYIGWTKENKFDHKKINNIVSAQALIPFQPFGDCLGGKLLARLAITKELTDWWEKEWGDKLYLLQTMTMSAGVCQYSGLKEYIHLSNKFDTLNNEDGVERGFYVSNLYSNTRELLKEVDSKPKDDRRKTIEEVINWWKPKAIRRFNKLKSEDRLKLQPETYENMYIPPEDNSFFG